MRPFILFTLIGFILSIFLSSGQVENPDTHLRLTQTRLLIENHKFGLNNDIGEDKHGNIAINNEGNRFMVYHPGQTLIFLPFYFLVKLICPNPTTSYYLSTFFVSFINFWILGLCSYVFYLMALTLSGNKKKSFITSIIFCLTSYAFVFAQSTYEHHFEMLFVLISFYSVINNRYSGLTTGIVISFGIIFRLTSVLAIPSIFLLQTNKIDRLKTIIGLLPAFFFVLLYNKYRFENPFETGYGLAWSLANPSLKSFWIPSFFGKSLCGLLLSPAKGLFFFSFTIFFAIPGYKLFWKRHKRISLSVFILLIVYLSFFSFNFAWHGSIWSFGPRYILPITPFFYLPLIYVRISKAKAILLFLSFILQLSLMTVNYKRAVLCDYVYKKDFSEEKYIFSINKEPHFVQLGQLFEVLPKNFKKLNNFMPDSPWKKEIRTGTNLEILDSSIEKNSINFWWVRIWHLKVNAGFKLFSIILLVFGFSILYRVIIHVKNSFF
jgi:hypothetical protein